MKVFFFHLMSYSALDPQFLEKHDTTWVTLPNSYYDPEVGSALYHAYLDQLVHADKLGFDGLALNEHHQTAYGMMPSPNLLAAALARETKNAKIAILGRALPLLANPLAVAEEYAMLDNLSRGRLIAGFVRGIGCEYHASGVNPTESHGRFSEAHDLIIRAWTEPGPFEHRGTYFNFTYVNPWPRPYQKPYPEIWIPSQGSAETIEWCVRRRYTYCVTFSPLPAVTRYLQQYKESALKAGYQAPASQLGWALPIYVAETDEIAMREAREPIENFFNKLLRMPMEMLLPPGYASFASIKAALHAKRAITSEQLTLESLIERGMFIVGSPQKVLDELATRYETLGFGNLIAMLQFGTLSHALTIKNLELFASKVLPQLQALR
jgi:alkanesulfonate monooxygenase SsuD/methylene tetrahydromethanopterin reductase-like flavin-dependent oxidoreductase (luciferase family)